MRTGSGSKLVLAAIALAFLAASDPASGTAAGPCGTGTHLRNGSFVEEIAGRKIHYEVHGKGPALMTVPNSWGLTLDGLRALYRPLEDRLTIVYFDPRGMGRSGPARRDSDMGMAAVREDFEALRGHLGLAKVRAIGWSNGAMNLLLLAAEHPETLCAAIFLHGAAYIPPEEERRLPERYPGLFEAFARLTSDLGSGKLTPAERDERTKRFVVERWFPELFADPAAGRAALRGLYRHTRFSWAHLAYSEKDGQGFDAREGLARIAVPSLVVAGARDMVSVERVREIHEGIPGSRFVVFERSGHFSPVEEPARFRSVVLDFLGR